MKSDKTFVDDFRISFVFNTSDPFVENDLKAVLETKNYTVEKGSRIINAPPFRAIKTDIAKKGNVTVLYDNEVSFVGVAGKSIKKVLEEFELLENVLCEIDQIIFANKSHVELVLRAHIWTKKDPQKTITNFYKTTNFDSFSTIFGEKVRPFTIRVATQDQEILGNPNWFDLKIEPMIRNPRYYHVDLVYKSKDAVKVIKLIKNMDSVIARTLEILESE